MGIVCLPDLWGLSYPPYFAYGTFGRRVYLYHVFPWRKKNTNNTDFEADRWPETGDFFRPYI